MFKVSRKSEYALIALQHMSRQPRESLVSVAEVSAAENIPQDVLAKVLQTLKRAGILLASKGVGGGYRLARPIEDIHFLDVLRPFEDQLGVVHCQVSGRSCERTPACGLRAPMAVLNAFVMRQFEGLTMDMFVTPKNMVASQRTAANPRPLSRSRRDLAPALIAGDLAADCQLTGVGQGTEHAAGSETDAR